MFDHTINEAIYQRACRCLAGGVLSNFKKAKGAAPVFVESAEACHMTDYDGNIYYDFSLSAGPAILGHSNEGLRQALKRALDMAYSNRDCLIAIEAAEKIQQVVPCAELVRFAVSGVDAVFNAIRVARAYTGKPYYVKFKGQYNGGMDFVLGGRTQPGEMQAQDGIDPNDFYSSMCYTEGRAPHALDDCFLAEYNDLKGLEALFQAQADKIACVIMEPVTLNMTGCMPEPGFLEGLRELCTKYGVLMIFDETLTGFRLALGGAQEYFGVTPDMCTFAKAVGGGFPVAVFAGKAEIMRVIEDNRVLAVGTYNGHPLAAAAVIETIRQLQANNGEAFRLIRERTQQAKEGMQQLAKKHGVDMIVQGMPGALFPVFTKKEKIINHKDALENADFPRHSRFMSLLKERGILHNSRLCFSPAHTPEDIQYLLSAVDDALAVMAREG